MKIGDVAERTGVPARMIRYYEGQGLLEPSRGDNGYRVYTDDDVDRVRRIRNHIAAGMPTRFVRIIFDMERAEWSQRCDQEFADMLTEELRGLDERIACLTMSRRTVADFLDSVAPSPADPARLR